MEGYNSFVSKSFVARQNCIQFGTNLNFAKLVRFYRLFYRAILSREEIDCRGVKKWRKVSWINLEQRWVIRRIKYNSSNRSILVIWEGKILNLIVRLKMRLISIFQIESRRPDCNSSFQISNGFFISLFLEQLISAKRAKQFYIYSRMNRFPDKTKSREEQIDSSEFCIGRRRNNARIPQLTNNRFYCFVVRAYSFFCSPRIKASQF